MMVTPWEISLRERLSLLRSGTHRVAYFAPKPDSASFRYRCYNATQALNNYSKEISASYFFLSDLWHIEDLSTWADTLVVFRTPYDTDVHRLITQFRRSDKKVYFDIDDLVFDVSFAPLVTSNLNYKLWGKDIDQWFAFIANIGATIKLSDEIITTNDFIAARAQEFSGLPVSVVSNFLNHEQIVASQEAREAKSQEQQVDGLRLGYFSGSNSHAKDFSVAAREIAEFLTVSPESTLTLAGHLDIPAELQGHQSQITRIPFMNFLQLQHAVSKVDVNLVPLQMSPFTFSKSELKYFEAAVVDTVTIASPTPLFQSVISHAVSGFLAPAGEWLETLLAISRMTNEKRDSIARHAREHALERYSPKRGAIALEAVYLRDN